MSWQAAIDIQEDIPPLYHDVFLEKAKVSSRVIRQATKWIESSERPRNSLYLFGNFGSGKTYIAFCLLRCMIELNEITSFGGSHPVFRFINSASLDGELLQALEDKNENAAINKFGSVPLLIIDDLGAERPTERLTRQYFLIIEKRFSSRLTTIFTSNIEQAKIGDILGGRIASRLSQAELIKFPDVDFRSKK